jgi:pyruvate dehydrogenase E2 component (dihydrolipoamide acetyltransferase)
MTKSIDITMPSLGADMTEGMLAEWLIKVGDKVQHGDVIAVLETQKGAIDMEVYDDGIISELLVKPPKTVPVGTLLGRLNDSGLAQNTLNETEQIIEYKISDDLDVRLVDQTSVNHIKTVIDKKSDVIVNASPVVRKIASEQSLDLSMIKGSGFNNAVVLRDIELLIKEPNSKQASYLKDIKLAKMRSAIASIMSQSNKDIPHFYMSLEVSIDNAQRWLEQTNHDMAPQAHIILIALLLKAVAITLKTYPELNGFYLNDRFEQAKDINIANVISLRTGGVVVPLIANIDQLTVFETMKALRDITIRSRSVKSGGRLRNSELSGATITITNMGERGADCVFGIIHPPQVAIIGFGKVKKIAQVCGDKINIGEQLTICLSADHRVIDGILAAKFLNRLAKILQKPEQL